MIGTSNMNMKHTNVTRVWLPNLDREPNKQPFEDQFEFPTKFDYQHYCSCRIFPDYPTEYVFFSA